MNTDAIKRMLQTQPFRPFRLVMSRGESYDIRHPEMVVPLKSHLFVALPDEKTGAESDEFAFCSYLHIAQMQTLQPA